MRAARQDNIQAFAPPTQGRGVGHAHLDAEQSRHTQHQPLGRTQRQVINLRHSRHALNRYVGVGARSAALARPPSAAPLRDHLVADPQRQTSTPDNGFVIFSPVTETVGRFGFLLFHTKRLPTLPSPWLFIQQRRLRLKCVCC